MTNRLVSVGDDFTLPAALKVADANLPSAAKATRQLAAGVDLNTITEGKWNQADNVSATLALNYPFASTAGMLQVDSVGSAVYQSYQSYTSARVAIRSKFASNPFGPWVELGTLPALNATFVRFVDLAGNPITARHVTIKVDTSTWDIADIVAEA